MKHSFSIRKLLVTLIAGALLPGLVYVFAVSHTAWGDDRYVLKGEARIERIVQIDTQLAIKDTEILFAKNDDEKEKLRAIKAIYQRQKEALKEHTKE